MRFSIFNLLFFFAMAAWPKTTVEAKYSGDSGEPNDPYQIANVADLLTLSADANDYNQCFII